MNHFSVIVDILYNHATPAQAGVWSARMRLYKCGFAAGRIPACAGMVV
jgi:hypothetical protein